MKLGASLMKHLLLAGAAATLLVSGYAMAQEATLTIEPAHRTIIKQYIVKEKVRPIRVKQTIAVGALIPEDVELQAVPETIYTEAPEVKNYEYFDWDGKVVFVEPHSRKVVQIVE